MQFDDDLHYEIQFSSDSFHLSLFENDKEGDKITSDHKRRL